jgi:hypothetical protein
MKHLYRQIAVCLLRLRIKNLADLLGVMRGPSVGYSLVPVRVRSRRDEAHRWPHE